MITDFNVYTALVFINNIVLRLLVFMRIKLIFPLTITLFVAKELNICYCNPLIPSSLNGIFGDLAKTWDQ